MSGNSLFWEAANAGQLLYYLNSIDLRKAITKKKDENGGCRGLGFRVQIWSSAICGCVRSD